MDELRLSCTSAAFGALSQEILQKGKSLRFQAQGTSMHPLVRNDDMLLVDPVEIRKIRVGDVILCSPQPEIVIVHRVIRKKPTRESKCFLVQGDQAAQPDGWIPEAQVLGRLTGVERGNKRFKMRCLSMTILSFFAVLRSRWHFGRKGVTAFFVRIAKKLPMFSYFLS